MKLKILGYGVVLLVAAALAMAARAKKTGTIVRTAYYQSAGPWATLFSGATYSAFTTSSSSGIPVYINSNGTSQSLYLTPGTSRRLYWR